MLSAFHDINLNWVTIAGEKYPIYCDLHALQAIQDLGYEIPQFEKDLIGIEGTAIKQPKIQVILDALIVFLTEGMTVYNALHPEEYLYEDPAAIAEKLSVLYRGNYLTLAIDLHTVFIKCFDDGKKKETPTPKKPRKRSTKSQTSTS